MACAGELRPDEGDALVAGHSVIRQLSAARQQLGYCPQARPFLFSIALAIIGAFILLTPHDMCEVSPR